MMKRTDIVSMLKKIDIRKLESDGPTSIFFNFGSGDDSVTFTISVQNDFINVTTGKFLFKRKYKIHKNEIR